MVSEVLRVNLLSWSSVGNAPALCQTVVRGFKFKRVRLPQGLRRSGNGSTCRANDSSCA
jgi:hypothetical protein